MTYWKTAADLALGADLLARLDIQTLLVWNRTVERAQALVQGIEGVQAEVADDLAQALQSAEEVMRRARIFVDSRWFTIDHLGDLTQPIAAGVISRDDALGDLFDVCSSRVAARQSAAEITLFKSGGGAHLDLMTAKYIAESNL